jgi:type IX secretion system PorP/SprF family membrane protein
MKNIHKLVSMLLLLAVWNMESAQGQQLPQFSQYMFNGLHINPGYAGYKGQPYIQSTYRSQWMNFPGAPETLTVTGDFSANEGRMGFGASILTDKMGPAKTTSGMLTYAYRIQTGYESFLSLGASAGISEYAIDGSMFDPNDLGDVNIPEGKVSLVTPNLNTGIFFYTPRFYAGVSAYNLVGKKSLEVEAVALAYHDIHFYLTAGLLVPLSETVQFKPSFLLRTAEQGPSNLDINGMFLFMERLWLGASYRSNVNLNGDELPDNLSKRNAVAFIGEIFATKNLRLGYAYDHNTNVLNNYKNGSHEVSLGFYIAPKNVRMNNPRWF